MSAIAPGDRNDPKIRRECARERHPVIDRPKRESAAQNRDTFPSEEIGATPLRILLSHRYVAHTKVSHVPPVHRGLLSSYHSVSVFRVYTGIRRRIRQIEPGRNSL